MVTSENGPGRCCFFFLRSPIAHHLPSSPSSITTPKHQKVVLAVVSTSPDRSIWTKQGNNALSRQQAVVYSGGLLSGSSITVSDWLLNCCCCSTFDASRLSPSTALLLLLNSPAQTAYSLILICSSPARPHRARNTSRRTQEATRQFSASSYISNSVQSLLFYYYFPQFLVI